MTTPNEVRGFITQVKLDASSCAVVEHGLGKVPTAVVVQPGGPGQLASIVPGSYTDTTFKVKLNWHDGRMFNAGTTITLAVIATCDPVIPEPPVQRCEFPIATVTAPRGAWVMPSNSNVRVLNEVWNGLEAGPQTMHVCSPSSWFIKTNQPKPGAPNGSIKSYPCTQVLFPKVPLSAIQSMTSSWEHEAPTGPAESPFEWNFCYDMWVGGLGSASTAEVMVWTEEQYNGLIPAPSALKSLKANLDGNAFTAWTRKNSNGGDYIAIVFDKGRAKGAIDLKMVFDWLISIGWLKSSDTLAAVNYGVEVASTNQTEQIFRLNQFDLGWDLSTGDPTEL